jgi:steroid 5-alpha reductase family enzyme
MNWPSGLSVGLGATALAVLLLMSGGAAVGVWLRGGRHDGVDVLWGAGFGLVAVVTLVASSGHGDTWRRWLVTVLTVLWGGRLAWHIGRRNHGRDEDPRYRELLAKAQGNPNVYALRTVYLAQGVLLWVVSLPVQLAQYGRGDTLLGGSEVAAGFGVAAWVLGFVFESVGDAQLARFRADPANKGHVMDQGLWRYTRHPNYFGDACVWWGLTLLALHQPIGLVALLSAAVMTFLLTRGSGARLLESTISDRRPGYADYVSRTSGFIPLPPRRTGVASGRRRLIDNQNRRKDRE